MELEDESTFTALFSKLKKSCHYESFEHAYATTSSAPDNNKNKFVYEPAESSSSNNSEKPNLIPKSGSSNTILVSPKQRGNPVLKNITNVPWEYDETLIPDYVMGRTTCALFLSLRYHTLKPDYIAERLKLLGKQYDLRVLLVQVDQKDPHHALKHLTRICLLADLTLMLAWSAEEAGRIIENYKIFQNKPPDMIMEKQDSDPQARLINALTSIRSINKTDATTLLSTFGSLKRIVNASEFALSLCHGISSQKASRLHNVLHQPFLKSGNVKKATKKTGIAKFFKTPD